MSKREMKVGEKSFTSMPVTIKAVDKIAFTLTMVASTQDVDRHGDTVMQEGWDIKPYLKNPVILNSHNYYDATEVIAKATRTEVVGKGKRAKLEQDWQFAVNENPKAKIIFELYAGGFLHASSVGFIPRKFAENPDGSRNWYVIEEAELLEVSAVSVPANAAATLAKSIGVDMDTFRKAIFVDETEETDEEDEETTPETAQVEPETEETQETTEDTPPAPETTTEETMEAKRARLEEERARIDAELKEITPAPVVEKKKVSVLKVINRIQGDRERALKMAHSAIGKLLRDEIGANLSPETKAKVEARMVHKAIRNLIKTR